MALAILGISMLILQSWTLLGVAMHIRARQLGRNERPRFGPRDYYMDLHPQFRFYGWASVMVIVTVAITIASTFHVKIDGYGASILSRMAGTIASIAVGYLLVLLQDFLLLRHLRMKFAQNGVGSELFGRRGDTSKEAKIGHTVTFVNPMPTDIEIVDVYLGDARCQASLRCSAINGKRRHHKDDPIVVRPSQTSTWVLSPDIARTAKNALRNSHKVQFRVVVRLESKLGVSTDVELFVESKRFFERLMSSDGNASPRSPG